jgi:hypothetical protein
MTPPEGVIYLMAQPANPNYIYPSNPTISAHQKARFFIQYAILWRPKLTLYQGKTLTAAQ